MLSPSIVLDLVTATGLAAPSGPPEAQANLINAALKQMGVSQPLVLGHSWGTLVAVALALKYPDNIRALILASGYYYPTVRPDVLVLIAASDAING